MVNLLSMAELLRSLPGEDPVYNRKTPEKDKGRRSLSRSTTPDTMPKVAKKSTTSGTGTPYWILKGMGNSYKPQPLRAKLTVYDFSDQEDLPDREFTLEVMQDHYHPSTPYHSAGKQVYHGPSVEDLREAIAETFLVSEIEYGNRAATRDHLMNALS